MVWVVSSVGGLSSLGRAGSIRQNWIGKVNNLWYPRHHREKRVMPVPPRISLVTLGTQDFARLRAFYVALGWPIAVEDDATDFCLFRTGGAYLGLYPRDELLAEAGGGATAGPGFRHFSLAINVDSPQAVDEAIAAALAAGATLLHPARSMSWGGYSGYFADPEGNAWEVAHTPAWPLDDEGRPVIPST
jgi:catechol 2,3-dioxygenase-like lactoylglutathione lyase family enzyme